MGFVILNLSEFAGTGSEGITQSFLLEGYSKNSQRQDNSRIHVHIRMQHNSADPLFKVLVWDIGYNSIKFYMNLGQIPLHFFDTKMGRMKILVSNNMEIY